MARYPCAPTGGKAASQVRRNVGTSVAPRSIAIWYRVECPLTIVSGVAVLLAIVAPQWLEAVSGLEPDGGSGAAQWGLASVFAMSCFLRLVRPPVAPGRSAPVHLAGLGPSRPFDKPVKQTPKAATRESLRMKGRRR